MTANGEHDADDAATIAVRAGWALAVAGQEDFVWGHVGVRDASGRGLWIKRAGLGMGEVTPADVHLVDWDGGLIEGEGSVHLEVFIHLAVLKARPDVNVSVHTHEPSVNAFSALRTPLRALSHDGVLFDSPQVPRTSLPGDLVDDRTSGDKLVADLGDAPACLMPRHGLVAVGTSPHEAVMHAVLLARACKLMLSALAAGPVISYSPPEEIARKREQVWPDRQLRAGYDYLLRVRREQAER